MDAHRFTLFLRWATATLHRWLTPTRLRLYAPALLLATLAVYGVTLTRSHDLIEPSGKIVGHDFLAFYMAGDFVAQHRVDSLYHVDDQIAWQKDFFATIHPKWNGVCLYLNPPHVAAMMAPLATLSYGWALLAWTTLSIIAFAGAAWLWRRWLDAHDATLPILLAACMPATFQTLAGGQNACFTVLIVSAFIDLLLRRRDLWAGLVLAALAYKFHLIALPMLFLIYKRRWLAVAGLAIGAAIVAGVTLATTGAASIVDYVRFGAQLRELMAQAGFDIDKQHSWHGLFYLAGHRWLSLNAIQSLTLLATLATLALLATIVRRRVEANSPSDLRQLAAVLIATALTSPHLFHYDRMNLIVPTMLILAADRRDARLADANAIRMPIIGPLLAIGAVWLMIGPQITAVFPLQWSALLMLAIMTVLGNSSRQTHTPI